jgi:hypothetical protein
MTTLEQELAEAREAECKAREVWLDLHRATMKAQEQLWQAEDDIKWILSRLAQQNKGEG